MAVFLYCRKIAKAKVAARNRQATYDGSVSN